MSSGNPESQEPDDLHLDPATGETPPQPAAGGPSAGDSAINFEFLSMDDDALQPLAEATPASEPAADSAVGFEFVDAGEPAEQSGTELLFEETVSEPVPAEPLLGEPTVDVGFTPEALAQVSEQTFAAPGEEFVMEQPEATGEQPAFDFGAAAPEGTIDFTAPVSEGDDMVAGAPEALAGFETPAEGEEAGIGAAAVGAGVTAGLLGLGAGDEAAETTTTEVAKEEKPKKEKGPSLFARMAEASPYTVMLGAAVVALLIGCLCLLAEWMRYDFDTKAKTAKRTALAPIEKVVDTASRVV